MSKGFLLFAHNNEEIEYGLLAWKCAYQIKKHCINNLVTLVSDQGTVDLLTEDQIQIFDKIIVIQPSRQVQTRRFMDTKNYSKILNWNNFNRCTAYDLSPYDQTILIDVDYFVQSSQLDLCWDNCQDVLINHNACNLDYSPVSYFDQYISNTGPKMYWATVIYFKKTELAKTLFDLVTVIRENWLWYTQQYQITHNMYRNDIAFSIAIHILNGYGPGNIVGDLPTRALLTAMQTDELMSCNSKLQLLFYKNSEFLPITIESQDVHIMNKYSLSRCIKNEY